MPKAFLTTLCTLVLALSARAQPPAAIARLGMGLRTAPARHLDLGAPCQAIDDASDNPRLIWAAKPPGVLPVRRDRDAATRWLTQHAAALGFTGFVPTFARAGDWHGCVVWTFTLHRGGMALFDAEVSLYFDGEACLGVLNRTPRIAGVPAAQHATGARPVLYALRDGSGRLVVAERRETATATHRRTEVVHGGRVLHSIQEQVLWPVVAHAAVITEYTFPGMNYPDAIWADSKGLIWFSEPLVDRVSRFDPTTSTFRSFPTTGYRGPDGLQVDDRDRVWFGLVYADQGLGMIEAATGVFTRFAPPYAGAQLAGPTQTSRGTILVTDHAAASVSEFDPATRSWLGTITMPTGTYPVIGTLEPETGHVYIPLYGFNGLGQWRPGAASITRIPTPTASGPAFAAVHDGKVYISYGLTNRLGIYDTRAGTFTDHAWRAAELGGPIAIAPNGHVVVGTRNRGYIVVFDPKTSIFTDYVIPTANPGLKDGLTVAPDGVIWFTETLSAHKIAKLVLP